MIIETSDDYRVMLRKSRPSDQSYVASTWANSLLTADRRIDRARVHSMIDRMLDNAPIRFVIACEPSDEERILGWIAYTSMPRSLLVHYAYVRDKVRQRGIGATLLKRARDPEYREQALMFTLRGPDADWLALKYPGAIEMSVEEFLQS